MDLPAARHHTIRTTTIPAAVHQHIMHTEEGEEEVVGSSLHLEGADGVDELGSEVDREGGVGLEVLEEGEERRVYGIITSRI